MVPTCSSGTLTNVLPHRNVNALYSIQTQGQPVIVLPIDFELHNGIHNYLYYCLGSDLIEKSFFDLPHTSANAQLYDAGMVVVSQKLGRKCRVPAGS